MKKVCFFEEGVYNGRVYVIFSCSFVFFIKLVLLFYQVFYVGFYIQDVDNVVVLEGGERRGYINRRSLGRSEFFSLGEFEVRFDCVDKVFGLVLGVWGVWFFGGDRVVWRFQLSCGVFSVYEYQGEVFCVGYGSWGFVFFGCFNI